MDGGLGNIDGRENFVTEHFGLADSLRAFLDKEAVKFFCEMKRRGESEGGGWPAGFRVPKRTCPSPQFFRERW